MYEFYIWTNFTSIDTANDGYKTFEKPAKLCNYVPQMYLFFADPHQDVHPGTWELKKKERKKFHVHKSSNEKKRQANHVSLLD
jgi:hypothetical protein